MLTAVDCAVMLIDAAKGLEPQTLKLFQVCRHRGIPVITVINKWDRPGRDPLELMDEIGTRIGLSPTPPLTWPVGIAGDFKGGPRPPHRAVRAVHPHPRRSEHRPPEEHLSPEQAAARYPPDDWTTAVEESALLSTDGADHDQQLFLAGITTPVLFASAVLNFGVNQLLDVLVHLAPAPTARPDLDETPPRCRRSVQRIRVQGPGRDGRRPPRSARLCPGLLGLVPPRRGPDSCRDRQTVHHQVRPVGVRPATHHHGHRMAG